MANPMAHQRSSTLHLMNSRKYATKDLQIAGFPARDRFLCPDNEKCRSITALDAQISRIIPSKAEETALIFEASRHVLIEAMKATPAPFPEGRE